MSQASPDRNALFGAIAAKLDIVNKDRLAAAMSDQTLGGEQGLGQALVQDGTLTPGQSAAIESLVTEHLKAHGGDLEKSLAAVEPPPTLRTDYPSVAYPPDQPDPRHHSATSPTPDRFATIAPTLVPTEGGGGPSLASPTVGTPSGLRFLILRPHARGGLGEVLLARDQELHREVALKQIQEFHADDRESRARFLMEAEITGGLEHPGIVPVYGMGTYPDGRPYYAMRFIRGDSLKEAIERFHAADEIGRDEGQRSLELRQLLSRFVAVCNAMAYAHSRGVIHRDIKPGNIMLGPYGETLVVDWGLARSVDKAATPGEVAGEVLRPHSASISMPTMMGATVGTPQYMSPEQAAGRLDLMGPAADIYSLGATLYTLLVGRPAVEGPDLATVLAKVKAGDFPRPRKIKPDLPQPLEALVLKAMALEPKDRYDSARHLADDIEHWLADEPVSAWQEPWLVKARRWVSRNRTLVTGVVSAVVVTAVGLAVSTGLLKAAHDRERQARATAEEQHRRADRNYRLARESVDHYHTHVSEDVLLHEPGLGPLRRKLLEDAQAFYEKFVAERGDDADARGELGKALFRLAQITGDIGSPHDAIGLLRRAREVFTTLIADEPDEPEHKADLAHCDHHLGRLSRLTDQLPQAEKACLAAVAGWEKLVADHPDEDRYRAGLARSRNVLANVYQVRRNLKPAVAADRLALADWERLVAKDRDNEEYRRYLALSHNHLGMVYNDVADVKRAEEAFGQALTIRQQLARARPTVSQYQDDLATSHFNLGDMYTQHGLRKKAEAPFTEAARLWQDLTDRHPAVARFQLGLAEAKTALIVARLAARDVPAAEKLANEVLVIRQKMITTHPKVPAYQLGLAEVRLRLGDVYAASGKPAKAEAAYREAIGEQEKLAADHRDVPIYRADLARGWNNLGLFLHRGKEWERADAALRQAHRRWEELAKAHPKEVEYALGLSTTCRNLGNVLADSGKPADAVPWYGRGVAAIEDRFGPEQWSPSLRKAMSDSLRERAGARTRLEQYKEALADWDRAIDLAAGANRVLFPLFRTVTLARSGDHAAATAKAAELAPQMAGSGEGSFQLAGIYSLSAAAASKEKRPEVDRYVAEAVKLLEVAHKLGHFKSAANVERLTKGPELAFVRGRPEAAGLLKEVGAGKK